MVSKMHVIAIASIVAGLFLVGAGVVLLVGVMRMRPRSDTQQLKNTLHLAYLDKTTEPIAEQGVTSVLSGAATALGKHLLDRLVDVEKAKYRSVQSTSKTIKLGGIDLNGVKGLNPEMSKGGVFVLIRTAERSEHRNPKLLEDLPSIGDRTEELLDEMVESLKGTGALASREELESLFPKSGDARFQRVLTFCAVGFLRPRSSFRALEIGLCGYSYPAVAARVSCTKVPFLSWHEIETSLVLSLQGPHGSQYRVGCQFPVQWKDKPPSFEKSRKATEWNRDWVKIDATKTVFLSEPMAVPDANDSILGATIIETTKIHAVLGKLDK